MARAVPVFYEDTRRFVKNIITLATPHHVLPYTFDKSLYDFYKALDNVHRQGLKDLALVSISGGLRDEMIRPANTWVGLPGALSVSTVFNSAA